MIIINQIQEKRQYNIPGIGVRVLTKLQEIERDSKLGVALEKYFPSLCKFRLDTPKEIVLTEEDALADLNGEPRPDNPSIEATITQEEESYKSSNLEDVVLESNELYNIPEDVVLEDVKVTLAPLESFKDKDELLDYGKTLGIELKKNKTLKNMYKDLEEYLK